jgi:hypothetical protein
MARMLRRIHPRLAHCGPFVAGLLVKPRRARRANRARERAALRREMRSNDEARV